MLILPQGAYSATDLAYLGPRAPSGGKLGEKGIAVMGCKNSPYN